ncbi:hypothetical protein FRAHR75_170061 [Frankia sp. Hr75.2]|nr:hypothetical protein FRAHR75_170061 [Frankia sp. Hr75.2]
MDRKGTGGPRCRRARLSSVLAVATQTDQVSGQGSRIVRFGSGSGPTGGAREPATVRLLRVVGHETGIRVKGGLGRVHYARTGKFTVLSCHRRHGAEEITPASCRGSPARSHDARHLTEPECCLLFVKLRRKTRSRQQTPRRRPSVLRDPELAHHCDRRRSRPFRHRLPTRRGPPPGWPQPPTRL